MSGDVDVTIIAQLARAEDSAGLYSHAVPRAATLT